MICCRKTIINLGFKTGMICFKTNEDLRPRAVKMHLYIPFLEFHETLLKKGQSMVEFLPKLIQETERKLRYYMNNSYVGTVTLLFCNIRIFNDSNKKFFYIFSRNTCLNFSRKRFFITG